MENILVVAPHPDDETLGCGGTLLKMKSLGHKVNWLIITAITPPRHAKHDTGENAIYERINERENEIKNVASFYEFEKVSRMDIQTTTVDSIPFGDLVKMTADILENIKPTVLFIPYINDVHTDHYFSTKAVLSCCKWFRYPDIRFILFYETISETDFNINPADRKINLNVYVDITDFYEKKIKAIQLYPSELASPPFPRSIETIEALALLRGSQCGAQKAEAFELLKGTIF
jgi:LmbE family N-acetylglucosaminyl deacetylase